MADVFCPACGNASPSELEECQFCGTKLKPPSTSLPSGSTPIKAGENPVIKNTSEFEKVKLSTSDLVHPGEAPTEKSTAALESTLPSWLRTLRKKDETAEGKPNQETSPDQRLPLGPASTPSTGPSDDQPDWLSGLSKAASDEEKEIPDWLASLREEKPGTSIQESLSPQEPVLHTTGSLSAGMDDTELAARLGSELHPKIPETPPQVAPESEKESLDWLDSLKSEPALPVTEEQPVAPQEEGLQDWLSTLPGGLEEIQPDSAQKENLPDWLNQLEEKPIESEPALRSDEGATSESEIPDWLSNLRAAPATTETTKEESLPDWLSGLEVKPVPESAAPGPISGSDLPPSSAANAEIPDWLSQFQAEVKADEEQEASKEQFEVAPPPPEIKEETGPLPEWLSGIEKSAAPSEVTSALIAGDEPSVSEEKSDVDFSLETPDWLSRIIPEQEKEKAPEGTAGSSTPENLEISELPTWVKAMRPVESVVAETKVAPAEDVQVTEQSGPLAGLQGVLPVGPGLGQLRKPPSYSSILQVTEGQQRYAAAFERLISSETQPRTAKRTRLTSNRLWRWLITGLLILAVGLPLITGIPATPASTVQSPEMVAAFTSIGSLPSNSQVLLIFDYDPALFSELEAAATPLMDHLLLQGPRLALISTNPTGPALAERFLHDASTSLLAAGHNYQAGQQYVNLGYLAGGPAGVQFFATSPTDAAPFTLDGEPAWQLPPLQGIRGLSDFSAIIVLTDNADSGRIWIEQTGSTIGNTPMLMVISAQVEPMILPYYDSGQIKGLVTGLAGGEAYGQTFKSPNAQSGPAQNYWSSFAVGTLVAEILVIIGAFWSAVSGLRARRERFGEKV
jgi:hypothetical protein